MKAAEKTVSFPRFDRQGDLVRGAARTHAVQFYEDEAFLARSVVKFVHEGLLAGQPVIVIARPSHEAAFAHQLRGRGVDVDALSTTGKLAFRDAQETLDAFMVAGVPDEHLFELALGRLIDRSLDGRAGTVARAYDDMANVLWCDGKADAALRVEDLWNRLASRRAVFLLCAYEIGNFCNEAHARQFQQICNSHGRVIPAESYGQLDDNQARARYVSLLQQRARTLEAEVERRKDLERALFRALAGRRAAETEREKLLVAERTARADAEHASRQKDQFLAVLSHELRTPLNAILGWAHIVNAGSKDDATKRHAWEVVERNAALQLRLVDDLLDVSRIVTGQMQVSAESVDLRDVIAGATDAVRPTAVAKSIALDWHAPPAPLVVTGDAHRLQQVVWNLLTNAIKFTPESGRVDVRAQQRGTTAVIDVSDSGQGIPPEFLPHVFHRFRQYDSGKARKHGGLGVGLAIVAHLVGVHGGEVRAQSAGEGRGSVFTVTLPLGEQPTDDAPAGPAAGGPVALKDARVLVVDDQPDSRELTKYALDERGATVEASASAGDALRRLASGTFDLIVADIGMPMQDGHDLIAAIRRLSNPRLRSIPAVALTAFAGEDQRRQAIAAGYDEYMTKPLDAARLARVAAALLQRRKRLL